MGSRPRIRWQSAARLVAGVIGCVALALGLPSLIRRPEPPPLEPDIGLSPAVASPGPAASPSPPHPRRRAARHHHSSRPQDHDRLVTDPVHSAVRPASRAPSPLPPSPQPSPPPFRTTYVASPPPPPPPAPPPRRSASDRPEFGFER